MNKPSHDVIQASSKIVQCPYCFKNTSISEPENYAPVYGYCVIYNKKFVAELLSDTGKPYWCNRLCPEIKANKYCLTAICATGNKSFISKQTPRPAIGECDVGLIKIAVPIFVDGEFMGTTGGCGLLPAGAEVEIFLIEKTTGMSKKQIVDMCDGLGIMTKQQA
jgi:ligand-binding sensor protein